jgi:hypothetical protein
MTLNTERHYAECRKYAHYAECRYAKSRGATSAADLTEKLWVLIFMVPTVFDNLQKNSSFLRP